MAKNTSVIAVVAAVNRGFLKNRRSSIGSLAFSSQNTNPSSTTIANANVTNVCVDVQPLSGPSMIPYTNAASPTIDSSAPSGSSGAWIFSRDLGMRKKPATSAITTTATLIRKIEPHQKCSSSAPLTTPPMATPTPAKPAQIAIARGRSLGGNTWARIDSVAGITNAAPTPITARAPITALDVLDNAANSDAAPNTIRPPLSASRRP